MKPWPHQIRGVNDTLAAIGRGEAPVLLTSPTGGGKTWMMQAIAREYLDAGRKVVLYTNRRMLLEQISGVLTSAGMPHGIRAAGHRPDDSERFQISSIQTETRRAGQCGWGLYEADLALIDEAHLQKEASAQRIIRAHVEAGAAVVGLTATPLDLGHVYKSLVQAGTNSELRDCGALVLAHHYGPDEPDFRRLKIREEQEISEGQAEKAMRSPTLWGRVLEWFQKLNPDHRPTILFAPSVETSIWFCQQFQKAGISAAHIDGADVCLNGEVHRTSPELRKEVLRASRTGLCTVICNRYVCREGIDAPWLGHCIFATIFGCLQSYLQSGGRVLRSHHSLDRVTVQDHGGNWWRWGSLNADRLWNLDDTGAIVAGMRADAIRQGKEPKPVRCPKCSMVRVWRGPQCPTCGHQLPHAITIRPVVQIDGSLKEMRGDAFKPRRVASAESSPEAWERTYWSARARECAACSKPFTRDKGECRKCGGLEAKLAWPATFRQAEAWYAQRHDWTWPNRAWPLMPTRDRDWFRLVDDVPMERLIAKPGAPWNTPAEFLP